MARTSDATAATITALDLTDEMLSVARRKRNSDKVEWIVGDATELPFPSCSFDVVTHGYLLRYLTDLPTAIDEQARVLKPGGRLVALETSPPPPTAVGKLARTVLRLWIPAVGFVFARNPTAYSFLQASTVRFHRPATLLATLKAAGFEQVGFRSFMLGTLAVYWGKLGHKPCHPQMLRALRATGSVTQYSS